VDLTACLDISEKKQFSAPVGIRTSDRPSGNLVIFVISVKTVTSVQIHYTFNPSNITLQFHIVAMFVLLTGKQCFTRGVEVC